MPPKPAWPRCALMLCVPALLLTAPVASSAQQAPAVAAAPTATLALLVGALAIGAVVLLPALGYLFAVFGMAANGEQRSANRSDTR